MLVLAVWVVLPCCLPFAPVKSVRTVRAVTDLYRVRARAWRLRTSKYRDCQKMETNSRLLIRCRADNVRARARHPAVGMRAFFVAD
jgi:hypothetical protein